LPGRLGISLQEVQTATLRPWTWRVIFFTVRGPPQMPQGLRVWTVGQAVRCAPQMPGRGQNSALCAGKGPTTGLAGMTG
jgi:hypothetical protein